MKNVDVTSWSQSRGWPIVRVRMSNITDSEKPKHRIPQTIIRINSSLYSERHFRWCCRCKTNLSAIVIGMPKPFELAWSAHPQERCWPRLGASEPDALA